jgi:hypothetical protein
MTETGTLTTRQVQGYAAAAARSKAASQTAQRTVEKGPKRRAAYATQAVRYLADVDALGIPRDHPLVAKWVHMSLNNIRASEADEGKRAPVGTVFAYRSGSHIYHTRVCEGIIKATEPDPLESDPRVGDTVAMTLEQALAEGRRICHYCERP